MRMKSTTGKCGYCSKPVSGSAMGKHLHSCKERKTYIKKETGTEPIFLLKISSGPLFWLFVEANGSATLKALDSFLRDIWLECCGHLSAFKIGKTHFDSHPSPDFRNKGMNVKLANILTPGLAFEHEYDFGTTTYLNLNVISTRREKPLEKPIILISRNDLPDFRCSSCKKGATQICTECLWEKGEGSLFCDKCLSKHDCDEEMALPVVNSPRMGTCGYTGD